MKKQLKSFKEYFTQQWEKLFNPCSKGNLGSTLVDLLFALATVLGVLALVGAVIGIVVAANYLMAWIIQTVLAAFGKQLSLFVCWLIWVIIWAIANLFSKD